ncbi:hypothetical protein R1sor_000186 [Riccia sorocarpa]|uniref:Uncharacterized protein n=1 Tax=Riccia sorocarpa TaxID=122646 RepID=A0ABD3GWD5_9MARC
MQKKSGMSAVSGDVPSRPSWAHSPEGKESDEEVVVLSKKDEVAKEATELLAQQKRLSVRSRLKALEVLYLQGNEFTGSIPPSLGSLTKLRDLRIGGTSYFNVSAGVFIDLKLSSIGNLYIKGTRITGPIPSTLGNAKMLIDLQLDFNSLTGPLPPSLSQTNLNILKVKDNQISGGIPASYGNLKNLTRFEAQRNKLTAPIPRELSNFRFPSAGVLDLSDNMITGPIPYDLALALPFGDINLSYNKLSGSLKPSSWYTIQVAFLNNNQLTGLGSANIPDDGQTGQNIRCAFQFNLRSNSQLAVPVLRSACSRLVWQQVHISPHDPFQARRELHQCVQQPDQRDHTGGFHNREGIQFSVLNSSFIVLFKAGNNRLSGSIPALECIQFPATLVLENNQFTGPVLPANLNFETCDRLEVFDVSGNMLKGELPQVLTKFSSLKVLDLSFNSLTGPLKDFIGKLSKLLVLDLSSNKFSGVVPWKKLVSGFTILQEAGASTIKFSVSSPIYEATFFYGGLGSPDSFLRTDVPYFSSTTVLNGNPKLCGAPLSRSC